MPKRIQRSRAAIDRARRVWPWDDDGTLPSDCILNVDRLPSMPLRGARAPDPYAGIDAGEPVPGKLPKCPSEPAYVAGAVVESDPDSVDGVGVVRDAISLGAA